MTDHTSPRRPVIMRLTVAAALATIVCAAVVWLRPASPVPPQIALTGVEAAVAAGLTDARQAVLDSPRAASGWSRLAMTFHAHEYIPEALACYQTAADLAPEDGRWPYLSGTLLYASDRERARAAFEKAVECDPRTTLYRIRLAEACLDLADLPEADRQLERTLQLEPGNPRALFRLAQLRMMQNTPELALPPAEAALAAQPGNSAILQLLMAIHGRLRTASAQQLQAYQDQLRRAAESPAGWPDPVQSQVQLFRLDSWQLASQGESRLDQGDVDGALSLLREAVREAPGNPVFRARLAYVHVRTGQLEAARQVIADAPPELTENFDLRRISATIALLSEDWDSAAHSLEAALAQKPDSPALLTDLGFVRRQQGQQETAITLFRRSLQLEPQSEDTWRQLVACLQETGDREAAVQAVARGLEFLPDNTKLRTLQTELSRQDRAPTEN